MTASAIVLAAGEGTRMRSPLPKVLHQVAGRPLLAHVLALVAHLDPRPAPVVVVLGRGAAAVREAVAPAVADLAGLCFAVQTERRGTAHAVQQAAPLAAGRADAVLVLYGDVPLLRPGSVERLLACHAERRPAASLLSAVVADPRGYGRVIRRGGPAGEVIRIVEEVDATAAEGAVREINGGVYVFDDAWLWPALDGLTPAPSGEVYLTDLVDRAVAAGRQVRALAVEDPDEVAGVNTPAELARADRILRRRHAETATPGALGRAAPRGGAR